MGGGCGGGQYCGQPGNLTCGVSQTEGRRLKGTRVEKKERKILEDSHFPISKPSTKLQIKTVWNWHKDKTINQ